MGTLSGTHFSVPLREIIAPSGQACMHVGCPMEVHIFRSVPLRDFFSFAGSFGPSNGHPMGTHVGTPMGHPLFKNNLVKGTAFKVAFRVPQSSAPYAGGR